MRAPSGQTPTRCPSKLARSIAGVRLRNYQDLDHLPTDARTTKLETRRDSLQFLSAFEPGANNLLPQPRGSPWTTPPIRQTGLPQSPAVMVREYRIRFPAPHWHQEAWPAIHPRLFARLNSGLDTLCRGRRSLRRHRTVPSRQLLRRTSEGSRLPRLVLESWVEFGLELGGICTVGPFTVAAGKHDDSPWNVSCGLLRRTCRLGEWLP